MTFKSEYIIPRRYFLLTLWLSATISLLVHFSSFLDEFIQMQNADLSPGIFFLNIFFEFFITFFIALILFNLNYFFIQPRQYTKRTKVLRIILAIIISLLIANILSDVMFQIKNRFSLQGLSHGSKNLYFLRDVFVTVVVIVSVLIIKVVYQNQHHRLEIQQLKIENLSRQFESLKGQLSPHFLFNSLTALKTLVADSPAVAEQYISHLSSVLRYTLHAGENKLVALSDEMQFVQSYFFLVKLRYNQNLTLKTEISEDLFQQKIPPLALQILVENAIRHNEISKKNPLEISISASESSILVSNNINPKITPDPGTGIGLANLANQYKLLGTNEISVRINSEQFTVEIPLLQP